MSVTAAPSTPSALGRGGRDIWRSARTPLALLLLVLLVALVVGIAGSRTPHGALDPGSPDPAGSRALAVLLRDRGVTVDRVTTVEAAVAGAGAGTATVFVPVPGLISPDGLRRLAGAGGELVVAGPDSDALAALGTGVRVLSAGTVGVAPREPVCALPAARTAGVVDLGGTTFSVSGGAPAAGSAVGCYAAGGDPTLLRLPRPGGALTLLGSADLFTNERLDDQGNAALALLLLGGSDRVLWLRPPAAIAAAGEAHRSVLSLLPSRLVLALVQLAIGVVLVGLWRARRLGPVVAEPLPVVVRSAEATEGRARLYRAAGARAAAAATLRSALLGRLLPLLGLPVDAGPQAVTDRVAARTGRDAGAVGRLLYGAPPDDDAALVRLADDLDTIDSEVRRS